MCVIIRKIDKKQFDTKNSMAYVVHRALLAHRLSIVQAPLPMPQKPLKQYPIDIREL